MFPRSTPFFPPTEASTMAKREVGILINGRPRLKVEATKPPKSVTTPPPKLMIKLFRSAPFLDSPSQTNRHEEIFLKFSPGWMLIISNESKEFKRPRKWGKQWTSVFLSTIIKVFEGLKLSSLEARFFQPFSFR